jgi:hypothetical protein
VLLLANLVNAQDLVNKKLFALFEDEKLLELKSEINKLSKNLTKTPEIEFFNTVFIENGETALQIYLDLFKNSYGEFKVVISKKLSDYYYAKGYYLTSSKYQKYMVENTITKTKIKNNVSSHAEQKNYIIQLGAFGLKDNAIQLLEMLQTQNLHTRIETRNINGKTLHCVWLEGNKEFSDTLEFAEKIKEKYHLQYRILQQ